MYKSETRNKKIFYERHFDLKTSPTTYQYIFLNNFVTFDLIT